MSHSLAAARIQWPHLHFGPVNLWSVPADWKRDPIVAKPLPTLATKVSTPDQVNPHIRRILAHR